MSQLLVIRHSIAVANEQSILMGAGYDSPLSEKGIELAKAKGKSLKKQGYIPDKVFCSKLIRARQTVDLILDQLDINTPVIELASLNERDFGDYDGKPYDFVLAAFADHGDNPPSVEPTKKFIDRVMSALDQIKQQTTKNALVVTHSNPVMVMQAAIFKPALLEKFWELGDPPYCEGFSCNLK